MSKKAWIQLIPSKKSWFWVLNYRFRIKVWVFFSWHLPWNWKKLIYLTSHSKFPTIFRGSGAWKAFLQPAALFLCGSFQSNHQNTPCIWGFSAAEGRRHSAVLFHALFRAVFQKSHSFHVPGSVPYIPHRERGLQHPFLAPKHLGGFPSLS